jgi:xylose isomerase
MKQATHFIEVVKVDGDIFIHNAHPIIHLNWSVEVNKRIGIETIAVFKIYPHPKPTIAHYDYDLKTTIVE